MASLGKWFGELIRKLKDEPSTQQEEHAVIVHFNYGKKAMEPLHQLESRLEKIIAQKKVGEYDGHEIASDFSNGFLYMYGPNAEELFKAVKPELEATDFTKSASAKLRFGEPGPGAKEIEVHISQHT